jgi:hypothetical protein
MRQFLGLVFLVALTFAPARSQTSLANIGVGAHGLDFLIGTWTCTYPHAAPDEPKVATMTVSRGVVPGTLFYRDISRNWEATGLEAYNAKSKSWSDATSFFDATSERVTTTDTGGTQVYTGWYVGASGKRYNVRVAYVVRNLTTFTGEGESQTDAGVWKKSWSETCAKSGA